MRSTASVQRQGSIEWLCGVLAQKRARTLFKSIANAHKYQEATFIADRVKGHAFFASKQTMPALRLAGALVGLLAFAASARADYSYPDVANAFEGYDLVVSDEFSGPTLNSTLWTPDWDCSG